MKSVRVWWPLFRGPLPSVRYLFLLALAAFATAPSRANSAGREETVFLFENRKVSVEVPPGLGFASTKDQHGLISVKIGHPKEKLSLSITFVPDPEGRFANARARKELIFETSSGYVDSSTEKGMQFEELEPQVGAGTYCVFTDANLIGKTKLPPNEFLHCTSGVKSWPGVVAVFSLFSNDTDSKEYQAVMKMLRESVAEKPPPLK